MKHFIFGETPRPSKYFSEIHPAVLHYVEGVDLNMVNSLPSGHTSSGFALYLAIAMIYKNRKLDNFMFLMAFGIGISRIYLSQHFLEDIFMGSLIGVLSAIVIYSFLYSPDELKKTSLSNPLVKKII
jgi:membrane-associated phospholipid phosphatase